ncbi:AraC family transcriptional regulator [Kiloniella sp. b19]|uniref:AraC family transcriptional regulator n=1 Tax=Kiloniella sp. GXU_MW_B19 TaxID=3141326 RepID=UPI0031DE015A
MHGELRTYDLNETEHRHDSFHQIIIPLEGRLQLDVEGREGEVCDSTTGVVPCGARHSFSSRDENSFVVLDVPASGEENDLLSRLQGYAFLPANDELRALQNYARSKLHRTVDRKWMEQWERLYLTSLCEVSCTDDTGSSIRRIGKVIDYIENNYTRVLRNRELAEIANLSEAAFYNAFRKVTGQTPQQRIVELKLQRARNMLARGHRSSEISAALNFADQSAFGRAFKKAFNETPGQFSKRNTKAE